MDFRNKASSNFFPNIMSETGSTDFVEFLVRLQAEASGDDFLLNLGGAAEDRLDAAEPPELAIVLESSGLVFPPVKAGLHLVSAIRGVRAVRSGRRSRAMKSSRRVATPQAGAWPPTTTPNHRPRISQPSMRTSTPALSHRGTAAKGPRDAPCQRRQPGWVVLPRAAARRSMSRLRRGRSPRQHGHVRRSMTTAPARPSSAGWDSSGIASKQRLLRRELRTPIRCSMCSRADGSDKVVSPSFLA